MLNLSIGQGANAQTLINMVSFYAALAGDGIKRTPYHHPGSGSGPVARPAPHLRSAPRPPGGDAAVVASGTATAGLVSEAGVSALEMAGKTGSGQVAGQQDIAWFMSFAPASNPKIVVGIQVEEGIHGGRVAKYAFRAIAKYLTGKALKIEARDSTEDLTPVPDSAIPGHDARPGRSGRPVVNRGLSRQLLVMVILLSLYGLLMVYSAGQVDLRQRSEAVLDRESPRHSLEVAVA